MKIELKYNLCLWFILLLIGEVFIGIQAWGQNSRIELPSSFNPVGSGARSLGMGGAFISIADDATAASWNPGALIQLRRSEFAIVGAAQKRFEDNDFGTNPEASGLESISNVNLNYFSYSMPCRAEVCGKNMVFSINYQNLFNFDKAWKFSLNQASSFEQSNTQVNYRQSGDLYALGLAWSIQLNQVISAGITLNLWNNWIGDNRWQQSYQFSKDTQLNLDGFIANSQTKSKTKETYRFKGVNANLGIWWHLYQKEQQKLTLGLVVKTPFTAKINHSIKDSVQVRNEGQLEQMTHPIDEFDEELSMPLSYGIGLSYQFSDAFTLALDIYRTQWDDFELKDEQGNRFSPISDKPMSESKVKATHQIRLGGEYRFISQDYGKDYISSLRAGVFYDPAPSEQGVDDYYGFSIGGGVAFKHYVFDIAYQYRFANEVNQHVLPDLGFSQDIREHSLYASVFYRF